MKPVRKHKRRIWGAAIFTGIGLQPFDIMAAGRRWEDIVRVIEEFINELLGLLLDCCSPCNRLRLGLKVGYDMSEGVC